MPSLIQRSFAGGEIAPALFARADQIKYQTGLKTCRNFLVQRFGGVTNRPGTQFIAETDGNGIARLIPFVFNADAGQSYCLVFTNLKMRVVKNGVQLEASPGVPYELVTTYSNAHIGDLQFVQSGDVVTLVHPLYPPRELKRLGDTNWTITDLATAPGIAAPTGVANTGAAGTATKWVVTAARDETFEESLPSSITQSSAAPTSGAPITVSWSAVTGAAEYYIYREKSGVYGYVGTAVGTSFIDTGPIPDTSDTPPAARTPFTSEYPSAVSYFQQRMLYAGSDANSEKVWASCIGNFRNFSYKSPLQDDDAITFTIAGRQVNRVRHMLDLGRLVVLTSGGEWVVQGDADGAVTPTTINLNQIGYSGAAKVAPVVIGNSAIYVQARGSIVRDLRSEVTADEYQGRDLTVYAPHLVDGYTLADMAYAQIPHSIAWVVRDDGVLLGLTYLREHEVWGWHRHDTGDGDSFERVCVIPEGNEDAVYVVVARNGGSKRCIERFVSRNVESVTFDAKFMDSHLTYDGNSQFVSTMTLTGGTVWDQTETLNLHGTDDIFANPPFTAGDVGNAWVLYKDDESIRLDIVAFVDDNNLTVRPARTVPAALRAAGTTKWMRCADVMSGLGHLEGRTVAILADGNVHPQRVVSGGQVTLDRPYGVVHIGLPIAAEIETLPLETVQGETLTDKKKRVNRVTLLLDQSRGGFVGRRGGTMREFKQRTGYSANGEVPLVTGPEEVNITSEWDQTGGILVQQTDPLPITILAAVPSGVVAS